MRSGERAGQPRFPIPSRDADPGWTYVRERPRRKRAFAASASARPRALLSRPHSHFRYRPWPVGDWGVAWDYEMRYRPWVCRLRGSLGGARTTQPGGGRGDVRHGLENTTPPVWRPTRAAGCGWNWHDHDGCCSLRAKTCHPPPVIGPKRQKLMMLDGRIPCATSCRPVSET